MRGLWELGELLRIGADKRRLAAGVVGGLFAFSLLLWAGLRTPSPEEARDFEECVELVQANFSNDDVRPSMTSCNARFAGRRKPGGGYLYYDFMMDRNFEIAGPNPTAQERKLIDRAYIGYLDVQRREAVSADLARRQNERLWAEMERARQPAGPPMVLTPANPVSLGAKREKPKPQHCTEDAISCGLSKITNAVKNAFAKTKQ
jgi:hypothetical protein